MVYVYMSYIIFKNQILFERKPGSLYTQVYSRHKEMFDLKVTSEHVFDLVQMFNKVTVEPNF